MSPPFIPDYKKCFIAKQFLQTCLGGLKLFSPAPFIIIQVILFSVPLIVIVPVIFFGTAAVRVKAIVTGCSIFLIDFCLSMGIHFLKRVRSQNNVTPSEGIENEAQVGSTGNIIAAMTILSHPEEIYIGNRDSNFLAEEDKVSNEGLLKPSTWTFVAPNVSFGPKYFIGLLMSSFAFGLCTPLLVSEKLSAALRVFDVIALIIARYSAVFNAPSEIATFNLAARKHFAYRSFYAALLGISNYLCFQSVSEEESDSSLLAHGVVLAILPVIWASGILPSLDALFPWIVETVLGLISIGSVNVYYFGSVLSLIISVLCPVIVFVVTHDPLLIILMECLCGYIVSCDIGRIITMKSSLCEDTPTKAFLRILIQPVLIISTSLICVLIVWLTMHEVVSYDWQLGFAILTLVVSMASWIFQDTVSLIDPDISKIFLAPMSILYGLIQFVLHIWLTLAMRQDDNNWSSITRSAADPFDLRQLTPFLLTIRAFSLAICDPRISSLDYTIAFFWKSSMGESKDMSFVLVLLIVSLITRRILRFAKYLKMFCSLWYASLVSNLLEAKAVISAISIGLLPISVLSIFMASICEGYTVTPLFTLPVLFLSFPRPMTFWKEKWFPSRKSVDKSFQITRITPDFETVDWKIYSEIGPLIAKSIVKKAYKFKLKLTKGTCYLARYEDRLIFIRVLSCSWNFTYIQIKGLEMQEQTSCHHQEAAEVDEKLEDSLDTTYFKKYFARYTIGNLSPRFSLKVPTYSESKSSVANLTNPQDKSIFQDMFYRAFSYLWIKSNPVLKGESYQRLMESNNKTTLAQSSSPNDVNSNNKRGGGISSVDSKEINPLNKDFSVTTALFKCTLPSVNLINLRTNSTSANPSAMPSASEVFTDANEAPRKASIQGDDPAELKVLSRQSTRSTLISPTGNRILVSSSLLPSSFEDKDSTASDRLSLIWIKQCVGDVIPPNAIKARVEKLCRNIWLSVMGNDSDMEIRFWEFFHEDFINKVKSMSSGSTPSRKVNMEDITLKAFRYATKLTLDEMYSCKFISETTVITLDEVKEEEIFAQLTLFEREYEFCTRDEIPMKIHERTNRIISIVKHPNSSDVHDSIMRILNYETEGVEFRVGQLDQFTVEGIWSNLNLELLYFTSDDDERFSIQSDRQLLRNIVTQCAKTPLGYPVYDTTFRINLFDFSVTEID